MNLKGRDVKLCVTVFNDTRAVRDPALRMFSVDPTRLLGFLEKTHYLQIKACSLISQSAVETGVPWLQKQALSFGRKAQNLPQFPLLAP